MASCPIWLLDDLLREGAVATHSFYLS